MKKVLAGALIKNKEETKTKNYLISLLTTLFLLWLLLVPGTTKGQFVNLGYTIYDTSTQLRWERKLNYCNSYTSLPTATNYCSNLVLSGLDDWYLPSVSQLQGIVDLAYSPTIDPMFCTAPSIYWTSTQSSPGYQFVVSFGDGVTYYHNQTYSAHWRCVRSSSCSIDGDCSDGAYCNGEEYCDYGACRNGPLPCPNDGLFCNGVEGCDEANDVCITPDVPCDYCMPLCSCDDEADICDCTEPDDVDCDTVDNSIDNCPNDYNSGQEDNDLDNVGNICDNCPDHANPGQEDADSDGVGDACEPPYWARTYGGSGPSISQGNPIQQTSDGGYIVTGSTESFGASLSDYWVVKLDGSGNVSWQKAYGASDHDAARSIQQTSDGGYIVSGWTWSFGGEDAWVFRLDQNGNIVWQKTYGGSCSESAYNIQKTFNQVGEPDGYIVAGYTCSFGAGDYDAWVMKLDEDGNISWQKTYGGSAKDIAVSIQQTLDGGYIVAAYTQSFGSGLNDVWILKLDAAGDVFWQKTYGGSGAENPRSIQQTLDEGYIVTCGTDSFGAGDRDAWVLKLDSNGVVNWQKTYGGSAWDYTHHIQQASDGGYIATGETNSYGAGIGDVWVLKLASNGDVNWQKTYGGSGEEIANSIQQTSNTGYIVAGYTNSFGAGDMDYWVLKLDCMGEIPDCSIIGTSNAIVEDTLVTGVDTAVTGQASSVTVTDTVISAQDTSADITIVCEGIPTTDSDGDRVGDVCDNCPDDYNPGQEDTYPPEGNGIGDACDCEADFNCSGGVDAADVDAFLLDFGRSNFINPCTDLDPCNGDFNCDVNVDAADVTTFLEDFGRSQFFNPCPACVVGDWCGY